MKEQELEMLRQFADVVFELTHRWDFDKDPEKQKEILWAIGNAAYTAKNISELYQEKETKND